MEEWKRVICDRRIVIVVLVLLLVNAWGTIYGLKTGEKTADYYQTEYGMQYRKAYLEALEEAEAEELQQVSEELDSYFEKQMEVERISMQKGEFDEQSGWTEDSVKDAALRQLKSQTDYLLGYQDYLWRIRENAEYMKQIQTMGKTGSFSRRNIDKTVKDFEKNSRIELQLDDEQGVEAYMQEGITGYLLCIFCIVLVLVILDERKKGLWQFVYAMSEGRQCLAAKRVGLIFAAVAVTGTALEAENIILIGRYYGGFGQLGRAVQSNMLFAQCTLPVSMGTALLLIMAVRILAGIMFGCFLWLVLSCSRNHMVVLGGILAGIAVEYVLYCKIPGNSVWNAFQSVNFFTLLYSSKGISSYQNVNICGYPVSMYMILFGVLPVLILITGMLIVFTGRKYPRNLKESMAARIIGKISYRLKAYRHGSLLLHELYKTGVLQKAWLLIPVLFFIVVVRVEKTEHYYDYTTTMYQAYMEQIQGKITTGKIEFLETEYDLWNEKAEEKDVKIHQYEELLQSGDESYGTIFRSATEYETAVKQRELYAGNAALVRAILDQGKSLLKEQTHGAEKGYVNRLGYERYIGSKGVEYIRQETLCILVCIILALSGVFCFENSQNATTMLKSTVCGREKLFRMKCIAAGLMMTLVCVSVAGAGLVNIWINYDMEGLQWSIRGLGEFSGFPLDISIGAFLVLFWILRWLVLCATVMIILYVSEKSGRVINALIFNCILLLLPAALTYSGNMVLSKLSVLDVLTVSGMYSRSGTGTWIWILPEILFLGIGMICMKKCRKDCIQSK